MIKYIININLTCNKEATSQPNLFCDGDTCSSVSDVATSLIDRLPQDVVGRFSVESALAMLTKTCKQILFHSKINKLVNNVYKLQTN